MTAAASMSHYVYLAADIVVKLIDAGGHDRLDMEIALAARLPAGLGAALLASGRRNGTEITAWRTPGAPMGDHRTVVRVRHVS